MGYAYILGTIFFTVYGQLVLKWRINGIGKMPSGLSEKVFFLSGLLVDPWIFTGFVSAFIASFFWMATMTKFELSYAYPFMSLNFVAVVMLSSWLLAEPLTSKRMVGVGLIVVGTVVAARG